MQRGPFTISDYHVSVYVGRLHSHPAPYDWQPQEAEVAEVLEVPLTHLRSIECLVEVPRQRNGVLEIMEGFMWNDHIVWGATGRMLRSFLVLPGLLFRRLERLELRDDNYLAVIVGHFR